MPLGYVAWRHDQSELYCFVGNGKSWKKSKLSGFTLFIKAHPSKYFPWGQSCTRNKSGIRNATTKPWWIKILKFYYFQTMMTKNSISNRRIFSCRPSLLTGDTKTDLEGKSSFYLFLWGRGREFLKCYHTVGFLLLVLFLYRWGSFWLQEPHHIRGIKGATTSTYFFYPKALMHLV